MHKVELGEDGKIVLETTLTKGQVAKFNSLVRTLIIENGSAYISIDELHGVLLTNSRERAKTIINKYRDIVKAYLVRDPVRFEKYGISAVIHPVGLYNLLEKLAEVNPKKASEYRASLALLSYIIAQHPQLALRASIEARHRKNQTISVIAKLKRINHKCQLCEQPFTDDDEKHVHHIEGQSEDPALATDEKNLIVIKGSIHTKYHHWISSKGLSISRATLRNYARLNNYSLAAL